MNLKYNVVSHIDMPSRILINVNIELLFAYIEKIKMTIYLPLACGAVHGSGNYPKIGRAPCT